MRISRFFTYNFRIEWKSECYQCTYKKCYSTFRHSDKDCPFSKLSVNRLCLLMWENSALFLNFMKIFRWKDDLRGAFMISLGVSERCNQIWKFLMSNILFWVVSHFSVRWLGVNQNEISHYFQRKSSVKKW